MRRSWFLPLFLLVALIIPTFSRADEWAPPGRVVRARYGVYNHFIDVTNIVRHYAFPGGKMDVSNEMGETATGRNGEASLARPWYPDPTCERLIAHSPFRPIARSSRYCLFAICSRLRRSITKVLLSP